MLTETKRTYATSLKDNLLRLRQTGPKKESKSPIYTTKTLIILSGSDCSIDNILVEVEN